MLNTTDPSLALVVPHAQIKPQTEDAGVTANTPGTDGGLAADSIGARQDPVPVLPQNSMGQTNQVQAANGASGNAGPVPLIDTHSAIADQFEDLFSDKRKYNVDSREWLKFDTAVWQPAYTLLHDIGELTVKLSRQILQTVPGSSGAARSRALENTGTCTSVRYVLQYRPAMIVREKRVRRKPAAAQHA
jgi:hypothetical protein